MTKLEIHIFYGQYAYVVPIGTPHLNDRGVKNQRIAGIEDLNILQCADVSGAMWYCSRKPRVEHRYFPEFAR